MSKAMILAMPGRKMYYFNSQALPEFVELSLRIVSPATACELFLIKI
jgi:hypothetical protein